MFPLRAVFYGDEFLGNSQQETRNNPHYTYTCLPYELRNCEGLIGTLYMDYVVGFQANPEDFSANNINIDLLTDRLLCHEREYLGSLQLVSDTDSDFFSEE